MLSTWEKWQLARFLTGLGALDERRFDGTSVRDWQERTAGRGNLASFLSALCRLATYAADLDDLSAGAGLDSDGRGKAQAALAPIQSAEHIARFFLGILKKSPAAMEVRWVRVNGQPGLLVLVDGQVTTVLDFDIVDGRIATCFAVRNPDKLAHIETD